VLFVDIKNTVFKSQFVCQALCISKNRVKFNI